ncbi:SDR family oxidoreductase [Vibrio sp. PP-XX7]
MSKSILLTGSTGFVGSALLKRLLMQDDMKIKVVVRHSIVLENVFCLEVDDINAATDYSSVIHDTETVIHCAARAHIMDDSAADPLSAFRAVNTEGTLNLALQAAQAGVKRFIFLSSIGVNGISSMTPFSVSDTPAPIEDYAVSKLEAEVGLRKIAAETGMEVVIIRPPLVYGPNAPGNFGKLAKLASRNLPLPFGAIHNKHSLVALDNLVDLMIICIDNSNAANQTFLVSDDHDVSTTELLCMIVCASGKAPRLIPVPVSWLKLVGKFTGKQTVIDRLCSSLQVDIRYTKNVLGWSPPVSFKDGIFKCFESD